MNNTVFYGKTFDGEAIKIIVEKGYIASIDSFDTEDSASLQYIAPGMIDIQVNGFVGVDYNTLPIKKDDVLESMYALFKEGVTSFLPTIITNSERNISEILEEMEQIRSKDSRFYESVPGYHIEGPFISMEDGPRGAHSKNYVRSPSVEYVEKWQSAANKRVQIITMSPEWEGSSSFIQYCINNGIHVAIGHTAASVTQIREAVVAGADLSTHLGNGCHLEINRHDNYIWQQLSEDGLWASVIGDGFHLPEQVLKVFIKVKGDHLILISDTTSFGGLPPGKYKTHIGGEVVLTKEGRLHLADNEKLLAGSAKSILFGVNKILSNNLLPVRKAWEAASLHPSQYLNLHDRGVINEGKRADFVLLEKIGNNLVPITTVLNGDIVYRK